MFEQLPRITKQLLIKEHDHRASEDKLFIDLSRKGIKIDLETLLGEGKDTFEQFRYPYEGFPSGNRLAFGLNIFHQMPFPALDLLRQAANNIDWDYVRLSRLRYKQTNRAMSVGKQRWHERPFAYEIYHQLRKEWDRRHLKKYCVIHAEVLKGYQEVRDLGKMPDILLHGVESESHNFAVVEIKLIANREKKIRDDLEKLARFQDVLRYESLIEILIGSTNELDLIDQRLESLATFVEGRTINLLYISLDNYETFVRRLN